jgi:hypothetical protein
MDNASPFKKSDIIRDHAYNIRLLERRCIVHIIVPRKKLKANLTKDDLTCKLRWIIHMVMLLKQ